MKQSAINRKKKREWKFRRETARLKFRDVLYKLDLYSYKYTKRFSSR